MKGRLIKRGEGDYKLFVNDTPFGQSKESPYNKLSLKNCQAISNGYDLDELACKEIGIDISVINHIDKKVIEKNDSTIVPINEAGAVGAGLYHRVKGFEIGFQKALELLGDKKFSKEDILKAIELSRQVHQEGSTYHERDEYDYTSEQIIQSLQQTEWDVEIVGSGTVYKTVLDCCTNHHPKFGCTKKNGCSCISNELPQLDKDGCLILKRSV